MPKVVINAKHGGFGLSPKATKRLAELQGRPCYFFALRLPDLHKHEPVEEPADDDLIWSAYAVPDVDAHIARTKEWHEMTMDERIAENAKHKAAKIDDHRHGDRSDPLLVRVVEEMGEAASGRFSSLKVVEVPDGVEWEIEEYDGAEWVAEKHRRWS